MTQTLKRGDTVKFWRHLRTRPDLDREHVGNITAASSKRHPGKVRIQYWPLAHLDSMEQSSIWVDPEAANVRFTDEPTPAVLMLVERFREAGFYVENGEVKRTECAANDPQHTHHPDDVAGGNLPTDTERAQGGDDDPIVLASTTEPDYEGEERQYREYLADPAPHPVDYPPAPITVREYLEGEEERPVFLHTHLGALQVTGINFFSDGPWLRTGHGWVTASWCVAYSDRLYFDKAEAERSAS